MHVRVHTVRSFPVPTSGWQTEQAINSLIRLQRKLCSAALANAERRMMRSVIIGEQQVRLEYCVQKLSGFESALRRGGFGWKT